MPAARRPAARRRAARRRAARRSAGRSPAAAGRVAALLGGLIVTLLAGLLVGPLGPSAAATAPGAPGAPGPARPLVAAPPIAVPPLPDRLRGKDWTAIPTSRKVVALTFDAGGNDKGVRPILRTLKAEGITATFFLTGRWATVYPEQVRRIVAAGHVVGNHTDTHPHVPALSSAALKRQLQATERAVRAAARQVDPGVTTRPWFRFPYGDRRTSDIARVNDLGYACIQWTAGSPGFLGTSGGQSTDSVLRLILRLLKPGAIVLMHVGGHPTDGSTIDADVLPRVIRELRARGYGFTTVEALLAPTRPAR